MTQQYPCALCDAPIHVADNLNGGIITVNVDGHGSAAHSKCPVCDDCGLPWSVGHTYSCSNYKE